MTLEGDIIPAEHREAVKELREKLSDVLLPHHRDLKLFKFLKARKYKVDAAALMFRKHVAYSHRAKLDSILTEYDLEKKSLYFATAPLGFDNEGALLRILNVGVSDIKGFALSHDKVECARFAAYILECDKREQYQNFQKTGLGGDDMQIYILDLKGLQWSLLFNRPLGHLFVFLLKLYEANYPESLKRAYIINAPSFFSVIYNFVKTILPADILEKVEVLRADQSRSTFLKMCDPSILPAALGGKRTDPDGDPNCYSLFPIQPGTPIPEEYYIETNLEKDPGAKKTIVLNQSTFKLEVDVKAPNSVLTWDFQTLDYDIGMCLNFRKNGGEPKCLLPLRRVNCHKFIESGRYECEKVGTYELLFDNTYSWWVKKDLIYKTTVLNPGEEVMTPVELRES